MGSTTSAIWMQMKPLLTHLTAALQRHCHLGLF
jgi:hypothetical protein